MNSNLKTVLYKTAALTFDKLGFMFVAPELEEDQKRMTPDKEASVVFEGPFRGRLSVAVCRGLLPVLAANMLGEDEPPSEQQQRDALGEIANVICGNVLPEVAGAKEVFEIRAPQVQQYQPSGGDAAASLVAETFVALEQGRADVRLYLDTPVDSIG